MPNLSQLDADRHQQIANQNFDVDTSHSTEPTWHRQAPGIGISGLLSSLRDQLQDYNHNLGNRKLELSVPQNRLELLDSAIADIKIGACAKSLREITLVSKLGDLKGKIDLWSLIKNLVIRIQLAVTRLELLPSNKKIQTLEKSKAFSFEQRALIEKEIAALEEKIASANRMISETEPLL